MTDNVARARTNPHLFFDADEIEGAPGLVCAQCADCGRYTIARPLVCSHCLSRNLVSVAGGRRGEVLESSVVHNPAGGFDAPYVIAQIRTREGMTLFSPILGAADGMDPGDPVEFCLYDRADGALGFAYRRASQEEMSVASS